MGDVQRTRPGTTIVHHKHNDGLFAVVGTGYAAWASAREGFLGYKDEGGKDCAVLVCDSKGTLAAFKAEDLRVVQVDGVTPAEAIADALERFSSAQADESGG